MKPLIALVAMALGAATVGYIVTIQNDPLAFTRLGFLHRATHIEQLGTLPVPNTTAVVSALSAWSPIVQIEEITLVGRLSRPAVLGPTTAVTEVIHHQLLPAPCRDGEYRLLDETRGVRLMCPAQSLK